MGRRYRSKVGDDSDLDELLRGVVVFALVASLGLYFADRFLFYKAVAGLVVLIVLIFVGAILWGRYQDRKRFEKCRAITKNYGSALNNFLDQFGRAKAKDAAFKYQQYAFTGEHLRYLFDDLEKHGFALNKKDLYRILRRFIDERERDFTLKSLHNGAGRRFDEPDGAGFEALIKRLYEGNGYTAQLTGRTGDQRGDLVVVRDDAKKVIQAKLRNNMSVGNDAVQQVIAAKGIHNCPGAVVTTNSTFTPEAEELARVHGVELVGGKLLRLRLQEVLGESWRSTLGRRVRELCAISAERLIFDVEGQSWGHLHCGRGFESFGVDLGG